MKENFKKGSGIQLVTLSGVDGSGKSTQTEILRESLERNGKKVAYFHAVEFSLANRLHRLLKGKKGPFVAGSEAAVTKASLPSLFLREVFLALDMLRFRAYKARLEKEGVEYLLSDRSFYDSLINIAYLKGKEYADSWLKYFLPKADIAFYLNLSPEAIARRERVPEQGEAYLEKKAALFKREVADWGMIALDADQEKEALAEEIKNRL